MLISRFHHVMADGTHWDHARLMCMPPESRLIESMKAIAPGGQESVIQEYSRWIFNWLCRSESTTPEESIVITYEDMCEDIQKVLVRIYDFYGYVHTLETVDRVLARHQRAHAVDRESSLAVNLGRTGRAKSTFRTGKPGAWQQVFDDRAVDFLKEQAQRTLVKSGYESNPDW